MGDFFKRVIKIKINMAILGVLSATLAFNLWKYKLQQHEKAMVEQRTKCKETLKSAADFVKSSKTLFAIQMKLKNAHNLPVEQPGINLPFSTTDDDYILMYTKPHVLIPRSPAYDDEFFSSLAKVNPNEPPPPLMVLAKPSPNKGMAIVFSQCSPKEYEVFTKNLYKYFQKGDNDVQMYLP